MTKSAKSAVPASVFGLPQAKKHLQKRATPPLELVFFEDDFASFPKASIHGRGYKAHGCRGFPYFFQWVDLIHGEKSSFNVIKIDFFRIPLEIPFRIPMFSNLGHVIKNSS